MQQMYVVVETCMLKEIQWPNKNSTDINQNILTDVSMILK